MVQKKSLKKVKNSFKYQLTFAYFCIYAFLGWLMETLYVSNLKGHLVKRGFLFGPICPIYGFGAVLLITLLGKYKKNPAKLFLYAIIIFSLFEYLVSFGLEALYASMWWDYSTHFCNLNGRITLFSSVVWGGLALLFLNTVHPFLDIHIKKLLRKIPAITQKVIIYVIFGLYLIDTITSCIFHVFVTVDYL